MTIYGNQGTAPKVNTPATPTFVCEQDLLGVVGQAKPGRRLVVRETLHPLQKLLPTASIRHGNILTRLAVNVGHERKLALEASDSEETPDKRVEQALVKVVVDATAVDALGEEGAEGTPGHSVWGEVRAALDGEGDGEGGGGREGEGGEGRGREGEEGGEGRGREGEREERTEKGEGERGERNSEMDRKVRVDESERGGENTGGKSSRGRKSNGS